MKYAEKTLESHEIFQGKILKLKVEKVLLPNGSVSQREIINHSGASAVVAVNGNHIVFVKQYRKPIDMELLELPAGKLDEGESSETCAKRELQEETGYIANNLIHLGSIFTTPAFSNEIIHIFLTNDMSKGEINRDQDEFMDIQEISIEEVYQMIHSGKIHDAKTLSGLMMAFRHLKR
ncbi:MAG: NUDIX domain-containing protein [Eubacteriales bacterium]